MLTRAKTVSWIITVIADHCKKKKQQQNLEHMHKILGLADRR